MHTTPNWFPSAIHTALQVLGLGHPPHLTASLLSTLQGLPVAKREEAPRSSVPAHLLSHCLSTCSPCRGTPTFPITAHHSSLEEQLRDDLFQDLGLPQEVRDKVGLSRRCGNPAHTCVSGTYPAAHLSLPCSSSLPLQMSPGKNYYQDGWPE